MRGEQKNHTVDGDAHKIADLFNFAARQANGPQVPQDEMVVGATSLQPVAMLDER